MSIFNTSLPCSLVHGSEPRSCEARREHHEERDVISSTFVVTPCCSLYILWDCLEAWTRIRGEQQTSLVPFGHHHARLYLKKWECLPSTSTIDQTTSIADLYVALVSICGIFPKQWSSCHPPSRPRPLGQAKELKTSLMAFFSFVLCAASCRPAG